jgi:hypothetical protein
MFTFLESLTTVGTFRCVIGARVDTRNQADFDGYAGCIGATSGRTSSKSPFLVKM